MIRIVIVAGTRPEAIKLAPVVQELRRRSGQVEVTFCATGQHREMFDQVLRLFGLEPDIDLDVMKSGQTLDDVTATVLRRMTEVLCEVRPDWVIVQGDTTTTMATAMAAFYQKLKVAHVEAGLRTGDRFHPFPEELNRRVADAASELLFAPTKRAADNLIAEGYKLEQVRMTGNTGIDALLQAAAFPVTPGVRQLLEAVGRHRMVLVTTHRRENFGPGLQNVCQALGALGQRFPDVRFVLPVHRNPNVDTVVRTALKDDASIVLTDPLDYQDFVATMKASHLILTDSGGVQEEAPSLGKPVLVMRERTERQEAIEAGTARLVGTDPETITASTAQLLEDPSAYAAMSQRVNPFGDGHASERIADAIIGWS